MIHNKTRSIFISFLVLFAISGCETEIEVEITDPVLKSFKLRTLDGGATGDCIIQNDTITALFTACKDSHCIPIVEGDFDYVEINGERLISGETIVDFNNVCNIECVKNSGEKEKRYSYTAIIKTLNGIPRIDIFTEEGAIIDSKESYVNATIVIGNDPEHGQYNGKIEIRGRGNATWTDYPKKPYKLKFPEKQSLFGFPANKDWILLAEYNDKTFLRTAYMCELSKAVEMEYTVNYQHVDLFLNTEYEGTYILTDQIEKAKERVNITGDGFIIEDDGYYLQEPLYFTSKIMNYNYTFKYPKPSKGGIAENDESFVFIRDFIDSLEESLLQIPEDVDSYKELIDINSFAKWFIATELLGNWEPNLYYVLSSRNSKLKLMPMWDAEWSLGLAAKGGEYWGWHIRPFEPRFDEPIWFESKYFVYLMKDPYFVEEIKKEWRLLYPKLSEINEVISSLSNVIRYSVMDNFDRWDILGQYTVLVMLVSFNTWDEEVRYASTFFNKRKEWLNSILNN